MTRMTSATRSCSRPKTAFITCWLPPVKTEKDTLPNSPLLTWKSGRLPAHLWPWCGTVSTNVRTYSRWETGGIWSIRNKLPSCARYNTSKAEHLKNWKQPPPMMPEYGRTIGKVCWTAVHSMQARLLPMEPTVTSGAGVLPVPVMIMET